MSCTGPISKNVLLTQVLETVFQLRNTPYPGASVEVVWELFLQLYPSTTYTVENITAALVTGARRGMFFKCESPSFSKNFYYTFNNEMIYANVSNREFGIPAIYDTNKSGSGYLSGCKNMPLGSQCSNRGIAGGNNVKCSPNPPSPILLPSRSSTLRVNRDLSCCQ